MDTGNNTQSVISLASVSAYTARPRRDYGIVVVVDPITKSVIEILEVSEDIAKTAGEVGTYMDVSTISLLTLWIKYRQAHYTQAQKGSKDFTRSIEI